jgi:hypothetical protein
MRNSSSIFPSSGIPTDPGSFPAERLLRRFATNMVRRLTLDEDWNSPDTVDAFRLQ